MLGVTVTGATINASFNVFVLGNHRR